jgi:uncharacterized protein YlaI
MNQQHQICRHKTKRLLLNKEHIIVKALPISFFMCKNCNSIDNLTIHHETYPTTYKGIIKAILKRQIYFLCDKCHKKLHGLIKK